MKMRFKESFNFLYVIMWGTHILNESIESYSIK